MVATFPAWADSFVTLDLPGGPNWRDLTTAFPQKGQMILQRTRPPLLETPFEVFDRGVFTPNDQFFVRWHWAVIPTEVKVDSFRLAVRGHVNQQLSLSLDDILALPRVELAAVNQCSGNLRGYFEPRASRRAGNGPMGRHGKRASGPGFVLRTCSIAPGLSLAPVQVRFKGLDHPVVADAPYFMKSLDIDHAQDGEVTIAYAMNGPVMPLINGFPIRLIVPGWFSTYWIKMLCDIEVLDQPDTNYWMKTAYLVPDNHYANIRPGETDVKMVPISRLLPRSFITNIKAGDTLRVGCADIGARDCVRRRHGRVADRFLK